MKKTDLMAFALFSLTVGLAGCANNSGCKNGDIARFDYFRYEGHDPRFDRPIDPRTQYFNPVIAGYYPDPSFCRKDDTYYLVNSSFGFFPGVPIFTSKDLVNWQQIGHVLDRPEQLNLAGLGISDGIFAPAIEYNPYNDTFYMITTSVGGINNFFVKTKDPLKGWSDPILLPEVHGIDPSFYFDEAGNGYIVHNDEPENGPDWNQQRAIRIHRFDVENDRTVGENKEIVRGGVHPEDKPIWVEGPHLYHIDGYYYLMCAEGGTATDHSEVIFRSQSPWGPYEAAARNPILTQRDQPAERPDKVSCTGHADLIQTPEGDWWAVFLGVRSYEGEYLFNTGRETFMLPVEWKDGFPVILPAGEAVPTVVEKPGLNPGGKPLTGNFVYETAFDAPRLDPSWIYIRTPKTNFHTTGSNGLEITALPVSIQAVDTPSAVLHRQQHTFFSAETELDFTPTSENDFAGLTLFQNEKYQFLFGKTIVDDQKSLTLLRIEGNTETVISLPLDKGQACQPIRLKVEGRGRFYDFRYSFDGETWLTLAADTDASNLSTEHAGGFVGTCIGLYATRNHQNK